MERKKRPGTRRDRAHEATEAVVAAASKAEVKTKEELDEAEAAALEGRGAPRSAGESRGGGTRLAALTSVAASAP